MKYYNWNTDKNEQLMKERGVSFERVVILLNQGHLLDVIAHPNQERYPHQRMFILEMDGYCYLVPFVEHDEEIFLKTIIPSRKATKKYLR
ncbi:toxin [candidate division KSB3 bacterium]|nr:toxin [candidate division KSB3 bacterium]